MVKSNRWFSFEIFFKFDKYEKVCRQTLQCEDIVKFNEDYPILCKELTIHLQNGEFDEILNMSRQYNVK
jgi:hypothetical protein